MNEKWDNRFLELAEFISSWSRDPSTKVGAVIVHDKKITSTGFNGFPIGTDDNPDHYADRKIKLSKIVHGELNAIIFAKRDLTGMTLYTYPFAPCSSCALLIIQSGIKRVVAPYPSMELQERWGESLKLSAQMFKEAGVQLDLIGEEAEKQHYKDLGWTTEKILDVDGQVEAKGEWLGFWRLVKPDGTHSEGWALDINMWHYNCFDGEDECWEFAKYDSFSNLVDA